jgi:hypothetical protein
MKATKVNYDLIAQLSLTKHMSRAVAVAREMLCTKCPKRQECLVPCQKFKELYRAVLLLETNSDMN